MNWSRLFQSAAVVLLIVALLTNFLPGIPTVTAATTGEGVAEIQPIATTLVSTQCPDVISPPGVDSLRCHGGRSSLATCLGRPWLSVALRPGL